MQREWKERENELKNKKGKGKMIKKGELTSERKQITKKEKDNGNEEEIKTKKKLYREICKTWENVRVKNRSNKKE